VGASFRIGSSATGFCGGHVIAPNNTLAIAIAIAITNINNTTPTRPTTTTPPPPPDHAAMKPFSVFAAIMRKPPALFTVSHSHDYKTFIMQHVLADRTHPLHETQKRRQRQRKREGLWWHVTTSSELSKSSCVRAWARRRLRNAVVEELKLRGYDDTGRPLPVDESTKTAAAVLPKSTAPTMPELTGSMRLHVQAPLIPAKFPAVRAEIGHVVDQLVRAANIPAGGLSEKKARPASQRFTKSPANRASYAKPWSNAKTSVAPSPRKTAEAPSSQLRFKSLVPGP
jgi:hypothetical protein